MGPPNPLIKEKQMETRNLTKAQLIEEIETYLPTIDKYARRLMTAIADLKTELTEERYGGSATIDCDYQIEQLIDHLDGLLEVMDSIGHPCNHRTRTYK